MNDHDSVRFFAALDRRFLGMLESSFSASRTPSEAPRCCVRMENERLYTKTPKATTGGTHRS